jgi:hypothetical protein
VSDISAEATIAFLKELTDLSRKHRITIGGCGCCGSPYVAGMNDVGFDDKQSGQYICDDSTGYQLVWMNAE